MNGTIRKMLARPKPGDKTFIRQFCPLSFEARPVARQLFPVWVGQC